MLDNYFKYRQNKTNFRTEVIAGVTTFLTMAYIMFLNPFILSGEFAGPEKGFFDFGAVFTATIVATAIAWPGSIPHIDDKNKILRRIYQTHVLTLRRSQL